MIAGSVLTGVIQYLQRRRGERLEVRAAARAMYHDAFDALYLLGGVAAAQARL